MRRRKQASPELLGRIVEHLLTVPCASCGRRHIVNGYCAECAAAWERDEEWRRHQRAIAEGYGTHEDYNPARDAAW